MKVYLTIVGRSSWAVINGLWAAIKEKDFIPDKIYLFTETPLLERSEKIVECLKILLDGYGKKVDLKVIEVPEADFLGIGNKISRLIKELKEDDTEVAVDVTPGRKASVAGALVPLSKIKVDHVLYLYIETLEKANRPYVMIPRDIQHLKDFSEGVD